MLKKIKWILLGFVAILIIIGAYVVSLVRYAEIEQTALAGYTTSLSLMEDVVSVNQVHRFNGLESYIVASIEHESGQEVYFFVRDGRVQHYFFASDLIDEVQADIIAQDLLRNGEIINTQLGILAQTPIFEVQIKYEDAVYYIVIDAKTSEVILNFVL